MDIINNVIRAMDGDQEAISELYYTTYPKLHAVAVSILKNEADADDIVQDSYIRAFSSLHQLDNANKFEPWLCKIVSNKCKDYLKKNKPILFSAQDNEENDEPIEWSIEDESKEYNPEEVLVSEDTRKQMMDLLNSLPDDQRICLVYHVVQEMKISEIADLLEVSESTVKSRINYAKSKMKVKIDEMEKKGVKLRGFAGFALFPFLRHLFTTDSTAIPTIPAEISTETLLGSAETTTAVTESVASASSAVIGETAKAVVKQTVKHLYLKIVSGIIAVTVAVTIPSVAFTISKKHNSNHPDVDKGTVTSVESTMSGELTLMISSDTESVNESDIATSSKSENDNSINKHTHDYYRPQHHYKYIGDGHWDGTGWREKEEWGKVYPTCTEQGFTVYVCSICEHVKYSDYVAATGHDFSDEIQYVYPGYKTKGYSYYACKECGQKKKIETLPARKGDLSGFDKDIVYQRGSKWGGEGYWDSYIYNDGTDYLSISDLRIWGSMPTITVNKEEKYLCIKYDRKDGSIDEQKIYFPSALDPDNDNLSFSGVINSRTTDDEDFTGGYFSMNPDGNGN